MNNSFYVMPYPGGNETIDRLHNGLTDIWIGNGAKGRKVMLMPIGTTAEEATAYYKERYGNRYHDEEEDIA